MTGGHSDGCRESVSADLPPISAFRAFIIADVRLQLGVSVSASGRESPNPPDETFSYLSLSLSLSLFLSRRYGQVWLTMSTSGQVFLSLPIFRLS